MANSWCPIHIPKTGNFSSNIDFKRMSHFLAVAAGSPGPLDKKIPWGFMSLIASIFVSSDKIVTLAFIFTKLRRIFFLTPKSITTIFGMKSELSLNLVFIKLCGFWLYRYLVFVETLDDKCNPFIFGWRFNLFFNSKILKFPSGSWLIKALQLSNLRIIFVKFLVSIPEIPGIWFEISQSLKLCSALQLLGLVGCCLTTNPATELVSPSSSKAFIPTLPICGNVNVIIWLA